MSTDDAYADRFQGMERNQREQENHGDDFMAGDDAFFEQCRQTRIADEAASKVRIRAALGKMEKFFNDRT